jgi:peptide/nickel transport system permease protein
VFRYVTKRVVSLLPVLLGVTFIVFMILNVAPGDPTRMLLGDMATPEQVAALRAELGLDKPLLVQYVKYMGNLARGNFGLSYRTKEPVAQEILSRFPHTIRLALVSMIFSIILAIPLGIVAAVRQNTLVDNISMIAALVGVSIPMFWLALLLILVFSLKLGWFPVAGASKWNSIVLPAVALGVMNMALTARTTRSSMLETIRQDYIRTARSKGLPWSRVIRDHAFKNALIPTITVIGLQVGNLLGGAVLAETVFAWPGVGRLMVQAIAGRDTPMVLGCIVVFTVSISVVNLAVDLLYGFVDPRIRSMYH